ncbi:aspartate kinase [Pelomonas sp. KK5]|uniref:amino acid kinase family protein n=1 Tax=Pelomonas sp. KK5 TaxID=1855730 RepID=UPI00097C70C3|nr:aspartate kinase [Pelomonas sp. KK5]
MWIVKLGGSLASDPLLPQWLELLAQLGGGRVTVVCGGGAFADEVRRSQAQWQFDDLAAHNMAVLAMAQLAYQLRAMNPALQLAGSKGDIHRVLHKGQTALWLPLELQREEADEITSWDCSSDTLALHLARQLNAERLVLVKSCAIPLQAGLAQLGEQGIIDRRFAAAAEGAAFPISLLHKEELEAMRGLLFGV